MTFLAVYPKCDGYGKISGYIRVEGGMCFKCEGDGCIKVKCLDGFEEFKGKKKFVYDDGKASLERYYEKRRAEAKKEEQKKYDAMKCCPNKAAEICGIIDLDDCFNDEQKVALIAWVMRTVKKDLYTKEWFIAKIEEKKGEKK